MLNLYSFHNDDEDDNSTRYCDVILTAPNARSDNKMSLTFLPKKPFKPIKEKQKVVVSSILCQFDPNQKQLQNVSNNPIIKYQETHPLALPRSVQNEIAPATTRQMSILSSPHKKSYRMQKGLKRSKSIVRTKKTRPIMIKPKPSPNIHPSR